MSDPSLKLVKAERVSQAPDRPPLGQLLVDSGLIDQAALWNALEQQDKVDAPLGEILIAEGLVEENDILDALAFQHQATRVDLCLDPPAPRMSNVLSPELCLEFDVLPWRKVDETLWIATTRPDRLWRLSERLETDSPVLIPVVTSLSQIHKAIGQLHRDELALKAVSRVPQDLSARNWGASSHWRGVMAMGWITLIALACTYFPVAMTAIVLLFGVLTLAMTLSMKTAAFIAQITRHRHASDPQLPKSFKLPRVSIMVPLFRENEIAGALIRRLEHLSYPKSLLEVVLVLEAKDDVTRTTIQETSLPPWISVIEVPDDGAITTKPRALNYALDFCQGSIIGVWDAEDAPEPDQIESVVNRFYHAPKNVGCLQGMLDYYNARTNWLARCFTIEYATWWRIVMPGMTRLGFVIPLGGTTLFFRREVLDHLGAWDAHNVTEDADLGVRLARAGYVTELLPTVTFEEANCRPLPWIRQRSRWLKGFMITYLVHMRFPLRLLSDLGWKRFLGLQVVFLATFTQFAAMPLLWSFWLPVAGFSHPVATTFGFDVLVGLGVFFLAAELLNIIISMVAVSGPAHRHLLPWVLTMPIYFTMGAFAAYKALFEIVVTPFYWDKTEHGVAPG